MQTIKRWPGSLAAWFRRLAARFRRKPPAAPVPSRKAVITAAIPVALVAAIAGLVSYSHITALGMRTHQGVTDSHLLFLPIDGLIVAGTVLLVAGSLLGWIGVSLGVAATLFANLQFGLPHGPLSAVVSTWPAVAFTAACFMLERWLRYQRRDTGDSDAAAVTLPVMAHANGNGNGNSAKLTNAELAAAQGVSVRTLQRRKNRSTP